MSSILKPRRGMLAAVLAALFALALAPAAAQATPATASCNAMDLGLSGCGVTFGDVAAGDTSTITVTLNGPSIGFGTVDIGAPSDPAYTIGNDTCTGTTLGSSCTFDLVFSPWDDGTPATHQRAQASLTISEGGMPDGPLTIDASQHTDGGGGAPPSYAGTVAPATKYFGALTAGATASQAFTITGTSTSPLQLTTSSITGTDAADYTITNDGCAGQTLASNDTCTIAVRFAPDAASPTRSSAATLAVASNADTAITAALSGNVTGVSRTGTLAETSGDSFAGITAGGTATKTYTLTGTSAAPLHVTAPAAISGADRGDYAVTADSCNGRTLNSGDTCAVTVRFAPDAASAARSSSAQLGLASDADTPLGAALSGTVVAAPRPDPPAPVAKLRSSLLDDIYYGGDHLAFTNVGNVPLHLTGATLSGPGAPNYTLVGDTCRDATLAVGAACDVGVTGRLVLAGANNASITVGGDATSSLTLSWTAPPVELTTSGPTDATTVRKAGDVVRKTYTFTNPSALTVQMTGPTTSDNPALAVLSDGCRDVTLAPGASCSVDTAFTARDAGASAMLRVIGNGASGSITLVLHAPDAASQARSAVTAGANLFTIDQGLGRADRLDLSSATSSTVTLTENTVRWAIVHDGRTVSENDDFDAWVTAIFAAGPDDVIELYGVPLSADRMASMLQELKRWANDNVAARAKSARTRPKVVQPRIVGKTCSAGRCRLKIRWPSTPGIYAAAIGVGHVATGTSSSYGLGTVVLPRVSAPKALPTCVTQGQRAATNSIKLHTTPATRVAWTLSAAARPAKPRGCASSASWPKLRASSKTLARGVVTGGGTARTTSMAKILNKVRLARLKPGFYRVQFTATSAGLASAAPASWWIQVLPREETVGS